MCLILDKDSIKTVSYTEIVVYKVVERIRTRITEQSGTFYRSSFYRFDYEKGVVYSGELRQTASLYTHKRVVEQGFHSYARLEDAKYDMYPWNVVVKCIIPAGAEFYKGCGTDGTPQYASNKIVIKEEV